MEQTRGQVTFTGPTQASRSRYPHTSYTSTTTSNRGSQTGTKVKDTRVLVGLALGTVVGMASGMALGNAVIGVGMGFPVGMALGLLWARGHDAG